MYTARSTRRFEYPHSLSYQLTTLWKVSFRWMHALESTILERLSCTKSCDTTGKSVNPRMPPSSSDSEADLSAASISSAVHAFLVRTVRSTKDTSAVGTWLEKGTRYQYISVSQKADMRIVYMADTKTVTFSKAITAKNRNKLTLTAIPVSFPFSSGITLPTALAAPVDAGIILVKADRPPRQSFPPLAGPSTTSWVAVAAWIVVMRPSSIPKLSLITLANGARQLVVQDAFDTMSEPL
mmetsp:Transcript_46806/g.70717  ORF Transcript_46806/g.70717 Transcript_46806/m.70717 type:complete len:239 (+) Transcript_46806:168-884(+)